MKKLETMKKFRKGWTTLEYVIGALIILAAVIIAATTVSKIITGKADAILKLPGMPGN